MYNTVQPTAVSNIDAYEFDKQQANFGLNKIASSAYNCCAASFIFDLLEFLCLCCVCYMQQDNHCQTRHTLYCEQSVALAPCSRISLMTLCNVEKLLPCSFGGGKTMLLGIVTYADGY